MTKKPESRAQLVAYLQRHPYLRFEFPITQHPVTGDYKGDRQSVRCFMRAEERQSVFVFEIPDGRPSYMTVEPSQLVFYEDRFEVKLPWDENTTIKYFYLEETPAPWVEKERIRDLISQATAG